VVGRQDSQVAIPDASAALGYIAHGLRPLAFPVAQLTAMPGNPRAHEARSVDAIAASLSRFGQRKPIVVARTYRGLSGVVVAGNGTLAAARTLGWSHVAVSWFDGSDDEARAFAVADNRTAELSAWDRDALAALQADGCDLAALWGGSDVDARDLSALLGAPVSDADWSAAFAGLPTEAPTLMQRTFTLTHAQAAIVEHALTLARQLGPFEATGNENRHGNALARICTAFLAAEEQAS
jgi:hypothetical protein